jgi:hypothetical protein
MINKKTGERYEWSSAEAIEITSEDVVDNNIENKPIYFSSGFCGEITLDKESASDFIETMKKLQEIEDIKNKEMILELSGLQRFTINQMEQLAKEYGVSFEEICSKISSIINTSNKPLYDILENLKPKRCFYGKKESKSKTWKKDRFYK